MKTAILIVLQLAASGSDAYFTHRDHLYRRFYETNPIARPFVGSTRGQILYFGSGAAMKISVAHVLRTHGHTKFAEAFALSGIADNSIAAAYSATH
jgi:hypothetical protein